jgi:dihydrofolate synthase/folylpolyglutamate synthase
VRHLTIEEALDFIHSKQWRGSRPGLSRTQELLQKLGNPQKRLRFVHVAGTNGKGSTAAMLASVLSAAGFKTGLYTSPYLFRFNERMQIGGVQISDSEVAELTERIRPIALGMEDRPTEFEIVTAIGMEFLARHECDIVVLEVGMGGRLDSTNVIDAPSAAIITRIGLDHTRELGETPALIAAEKGGIIKTGSRVVLYEQEREVMDVISNICFERGAPLRTAEFSQIICHSSDREGSVFSYKEFKNIRLPLLGAHQLSNAAVVLEGVFSLRECGFEIPDSAVEKGLASVKWPARFEIVSREPWFVVDGGHNPQCAETVAANLKKYFPREKRVLLVGVLADKDFAGLTDLLAPVADRFVTVTPDNPRALSAEELARHLEKYGKPVSACDSIAEGVRRAIDLAGKDGVVCAVGSLYMAGAIRECFGLF